MPKEIAMFDSEVPAYLVGVESQVGTDLMAGVGQGGNRISLKGSRFRLVVNGVEESVVEQSHIDVAILASAPAISRQYFAGSYQSGANDPPTCYSADGVAPATDVAQPQADKCALCPHNVKGSRMVNDVASKECSYFRRLVVWLVNDPSETVFRLDVKGMGLFGPKSANGQAGNLGDYAKMLSTRGLNAATVVTRVSFDPDSSVPKLLFRPARYVSEEELATVQELAESQLVQELREVSMPTLQDVLPHTQEDESEPAPAKPAPAKPAPAKPAPAKPAPAEELEIDVSNNSELEDILNGLD